jgi:hypothetical protein
MMALVDTDKLFEEVKARHEELARMVYVEEDHIVLNVHYEYNIALNRCDTHEKILGWCIHLCEKTWMTPELIRRFAQIAAQANGLEEPEAP